MINTISLNRDNGEGLSANSVFKVVLGSVNRRFDYKPYR